MTLNRVAVFALLSVAAAVRVDAQSTAYKDTLRAAVSRLRDALLSRQPGEGCAGPGAALGVLALRCASCGIERLNGKTIYSFYAEPVITQVTASSVLRPGDVIEAVGGKPITTADGAFAFTSPVELLTYARLADVDPKDIESVEVVKGAAAVAAYGANAQNGVVTIITKKVDGSRTTTTTTRKLLLGDTVQLRQRSFASGEPLIIIDGVVQPSRAIEIGVQVRRDGKSIALMAPLTDRCNEDPRPAPAPRDSVRTVPAGLAAPDEGTGRFGLAVSCAPSCTRARAHDGTDYWKFDSYPPVVAVRSGGPADLVGLKFGDRVTEVDGLSILTEAGALRFLHNESKNSMHLMVLRDGTRMAYLMRLGVRVRAKPGT